MGCRLACPETRRKNCLGSAPERSAPRTFPPLTNGRLENLPSRLTWWVAAGWDLSASRSHRICCPARSRPAPSHSHGRLHGVPVANGHASPTAVLNGVAGRGSHACYASSGPRLNSMRLRRSKSTTTIFADEPSRLFSYPRNRSGNRFGTILSAGLALQIFRYASQILVTVRLPSMVRAPRSFPRRMSTAMRPALDQCFELHRAAPQSR